MADENQLLQALSVAVYTTDAQGRLTFYNEAAAELWGQRPDPGALWCGSWKLFHLDGTPMAHEDCPMAISLREGRPVRGVDALLERPDGSRTPFRPYPTPLRDDDGKITGGINLLVDLSERHQSLEDSERLAAIVASSDDAIISKTLGGIITSWNAAAERIFGYSADEMIGESILRLIPADLQDEERQIIAQLTRGQRVDHYETIRLAKDGRAVELSLTVSPMRDAGGRIVGASKVARDISERKRAEEVQRLLLNELNHRIKNTLATVQAIAGQTLRRAPSPADFVTSFNGRIQSLSRAHMLLTAGTFQSAEISQLVRDQLLLGGPPDPRIETRGPALMLEADAALHLALVLHELGTNARKYGALSTTTGKVAVAWDMRTDGRRRLHLDWRESGGPPVSAPSSRGFGSVLIEHSLQAHGGTVETRYAEAGVSCVIDLPLPEMTQPLRSPPRASGAMGARRSNANSSRLEGKRILVIEDEALIAMEIGDHLTDAGCVVVGPAQSLKDAMELIAQADFDGVLLDGNLAGRSVEDAALALARKGTPFVFVTGYGREALPEAFRDGVIIEKPFSREQLLAALGRVLNLAGNVVALKPHASPSPSLTASIGRIE